MENGLRTWIKINTSAISHNYQQFRKLLGKNRLLMAVVKSNAYGHGLWDFAKTLERLGIDWLGVDSITEGARLRKEGIKTNILVLGHILPERLRDAWLNDISVTVSNFEGLKELTKRAPASKKINIHLKIDTGMHRQGFFPEELAEVLAVLKEHKNIALQGIYTHFAAAGNPNLSRNTLRQMEVFNKASGFLKKQGFNLIRHAAATAASFNFPESRLDMARIGIGLYGLTPSKETKAAFSKKICLKPVLSWKTIVAEVKNIPKGSGVGYDFTEKVKRDSRMAVLPVGYWHGYPIALSGKSYVLIKGKRAKVLGRVSMDMIAVDITGIKNAKVGDEAVLIGRSKREEISADELAEISGTINYEIITRLNPLIKRFYR